MQQAQPEKTAGTAAFLCILENSARGRRTLCAGRSALKTLGRRVDRREELDQSCAKAMCSGIRWAGLAAVLAAAGARDRLRMLALLFQGPGSHHSLEALTKLQAGPLYHHLNRLRLAGLVTSSERDRYALTERGRRLLLGLTALSEMLGRAK